MAQTDRTFLPAAGSAWLLPFYDPFVKLLGGDRSRRHLLDQAAVRPGQRVLDIGCGTGTFIVMMKSLHPDVEVTGLDPDPNALARARKKLERAGLSAKLDQGFADELPYPDASFDLVFSSLMFHHLEGDQKEKTLAEVRRVLKPGGAFHMLDFAHAESGSNGLLAHLVHSHHRLSDNAESRVLALMSRAGLADPRKLDARRQLFGRIAWFQATAP